MILWASICTADLHEGDEFLFSCLDSGEGKLRAQGPWRGVEEDTRTLRGDSV